MSTHLEGVNGLCRPLTSCLGGDLLGHTMHKSVKDIGKPVEGVVIAVSAKFTVDSLKECLENGAKWVTIVPGGFRETGTEEGIFAEVGNHCSLAHAFALQCLFGNGQG